MAQYYQIQNLDEYKPIYEHVQVVHVASDDVAVSTYNQSQPLVLQEDQILLNEGQQVVYQTAGTASTASYQQQTGAGTTHFDMTSRSPQTATSTHYIISGGDEIVQQQPQQQQQHSQIVLQQQHQAMEQQQHHIATQQQSQHYIQDSQSQQQQQQLTTEHQLHMQQQQQTQQVLQQPQQTQVFYTGATTEQILHRQQQQQQPQTDMQQLHMEQQQQQQTYQQQQQQTLVHQQQQQQHQQRQQTQQQPTHTLQAQQQMIYRIPPQQQQHHTQLQQATQVLNNTHHVIVPSGHQVMIQSSPQHHILQQQQQQQQQQQNRLIYNGTRFLYAQPQQPQQQQPHIHLQTNALHSQVPVTTRLVRVASSTPHQQVGQSPQHTQTQSPHTQQQIHPTSSVVFHSLSPGNMQTAQMQSKTILQQQQEQQQVQHVQIQQQQQQQPQPQQTQSQLISTPNPIRGIGIRAKVARGAISGLTGTSGATIITCAPPAVAIRGSGGIAHRTPRPPPNILKSSRQRAITTGGSPRGRGAARGGRGAANIVNRANAQIVGPTEVVGTVSGASGLHALGPHQQQAQSIQGKNMTITLGQHAQFKQIQRTQQMQIDATQQHSPAQMQYVQNTIGTPPQQGNSIRFRSPSSINSPSPTQPVIPMSSGSGFSNTNLEHDLEESIQAVVVKKDTPTAKKTTLVTGSGGGTMNTSPMSGSGATLTTYYPDDDNRMIRTQNGMLLTEFKKRNPSQNLNQSNVLNIASNKFATVRGPQPQVTAAVAPNRPSIALAGNATQTNSTAVARNSLLRSQPASQQMCESSQACSTTTTLSTTVPSSSVHQTSHNNYEIQTQHVLQNRSGQQMAEKDRNSAKMLVILVSGEQRLITFTLPRESCTVQDLLEQVGVQFDSTTTIQCVENPGANIDFVVTVGFSVHESASELISRAEQSLQMSKQQESSSTTSTSEAPSSSGSTMSSGISSTAGASSGAAAAYSSLVDATASGGDSESSKDSSGQNSSGPSGNKTADTVPRKVISGFFAVCQSCGFSGYDHAKCERCKRVFLEPPRRVPCNKTLSNSSSSDTSNILDKKRIFTEPISRTPKGSSSLAFNAGTVSLRGRGGAGMNPRSRSSRNRPKNAEIEPVILTLSSDDEDDNAKKGSNNASLLKSPNNSGRISMIQKSFSFEQCMPEKDETAFYSDFQRNDVTDMSQLIGPKISTSIRCSSVYIGTHQFEPIEPIIFTSKGIKIAAPVVSDPTITRHLNIHHGEVVKVVADFSVAQTSLICVYVAKGCAQYIRTALNIQDADSGKHSASIAWNFSATGHQKLRKIVMVCDSIPEEACDIIRSVFRFIDEISFSDAQQMLQHIKDGQSFLNANQTADESSNSTAIGNNSLLSSAGAKLNRPALIYPPGKGGIAIHIEDYMCLASDQYLNDIIIDFYLKWIHTNVIPTSEDRDKTFIFSTFFYKRLTTMTRYNHQDKEVKQTAAQKRHARVQSWTKNVNLFEKDFIIIPINEQSHWFLAIICFPRLTGPVTFDTNVPVDPNEIKKQRGKKMTLLIGNTTITPLSKRDSAPTAASLVANYGVSSANTSVDADDGSERDEAEGDESDLASEDSSDFDNVGCGSSGGTENTTKNNSNVNNSESTSSNSKQDSNGEASNNGGNTATPASSDTNDKTNPHLRAIKQPLILIFDSLAGASRSRVVATLRDYLTCEYKSKMPANGPQRIFSKDNMPGHCVKVPQQNNFTDCGLFLLQYVEQFYTDPIKDYRVPIKQLSNWFDTITVTRKREEISHLLKRLINESHDSNGEQRKCLFPEIPFPTLNGELIEQPENVNAEFEEEDILDLEHHDEMEDLERIGGARDNPSDDANEEQIAPPANQSNAANTTNASNPSSMAIATVPPTQGKKIVLKRRVVNSTSNSSGDYFTAVASDSSNINSSPATRSGSNPVKVRILEQ